MDRRVSNGNGIGGRVPDGWFTRSQAAKLVGRSPDTLKRWQAAGVYRATSHMEMGQLTVWLYSAADIAAMKEMIRKSVA